LKPDVCRRVVGRLPSPHIQDSRLGLDLVSTARDGATIQLSHSLLRRGREWEIDGGLSCEIVSDLCPNPFSHDWHVQPSCQRPNRLPPERRAFRSRRIRYKSKSGCPRNLANISCGVEPCQSAHRTEFPRDFHTGKDWRRTEEPNIPALGFGLPAFGSARNSTRRYCLPLGS
jgi:hypothetical protein